jgi:hypothetical protein
VKYSLPEGKQKSDFSLTYDTHINYGYLFREIADDLGIPYIMVSKVIKGITYEK